MYGKYQIERQVWWWLCVLAWWALFLMCCQRVHASTFSAQAQLLAISIRVAAETDPQEISLLAQPILGDWWHVTLPSDLEHVSPELRDCHPAGEWQLDRTLSTCQSVKQGDTLLFRLEMNQVDWQDERRHVFVEKATDFPAPSQQYGVIISEVMWAGSYQGERSLSADEWIELHNPGSMAVNLRGCILRGARSSGHDLSIHADLVIPPAGWVLVSRQVSESSLSRNPEWSSPDLVLSNSRAGIGLECGGTMIDQVPAGNWQLGRNDTNLRIRSSVQRNVFAPTDFWDSWWECQDEGSVCSAGWMYWKESAQGQNLATPWQPNLK